MLNFCRLMYYKLLSYPNKFHKLLMLETNKIFKNMNPKISILILAVVSFLAFSGLLLYSLNQLLYRLGTHVKFLQLFFAHISFIARRQLIRCYNNKHSCYCYCCCCCCSGATTTTTKVNGKPVCHQLSTSRQS